MCSLNCSSSGLHHRLVHEFCHGLAKTITLVFFCYFLALPKIQTMVSKIHIPTLDNLAATNEAQWKTELFEFSLLPPHMPIGHQ
jgi:hypothetical protein